jgi:hypothetical protein
MSFIMNTFILFTPSVEGLHQEIDTLSLAMENSISVQNFTAAEVLQVKGSTLS